MVKWSSVRSIDEGTQKIASFFFPILKERKRVNILGEKEEAKRIYNLFKQRAREISPDTKVVFNSSTKKDDFEILVRIPSKKEAVLGCKQGSSSDCVTVKAMNEFEKKERSDSTHWMSVYRLNEFQALFLIIKDRS